jgi:hypothetical protein
MPKSITVRFYEIGKLTQHGASLRQALQEIFGSGPPGDREVQLSEGFTCRLERLHTTAGFVSGEMLRVRTTDFPCEVLPQGTRRLGVDGPIGDGIAFRFRDADSRLAIQYDPRVVSPGRMFDYIAQWHGTPLFGFTPTMDDDAIARFRAQPLRKVKIKLATPRNLAAIEDAAAPAAIALRDLGEDYEAPIVTLELSMGHAKGHLAEGAKQMTEGFLRMLGEGADVRSIVVTPDAGEGVDNEDINLLDQLLSDKDEIASPPNDPDAIYDVCARHVECVLARHQQ